MELTGDEMDRWRDLTGRIKANIWRQDEGTPDDYLAKLYRDRHQVLETAGRKIAALEATLRRAGLQTLRHALIYATDKDPDQLNRVNGLLRNLGIPFHQLTAEETANASTTERILQAFRDGTLRVLTAKRVLDEGVNIPQVQCAFILASTTVERQWIQRRGRILRMCRETDKTHSVIYDFIALPPQTTPADSEARTVIRGELARIQEFARLAQNAAAPDGPLNVIQELLHRLLD